nr:hypothetical protein [Candidatus Bathyarchaeota archaeon]
MPGSVMVLGGCGEIGRSVVRDLLETSRFSKVIVADYREEYGLRFVEGLGSRKAVFRKVNVKDKEGLVESLKGVDVVVNTVGPFFEFGTAAAQAALEAGVNYVDICDDHDVTESLLNLNRLAEREGLTFIINAGASPGLTNIMAKMAAERLDEVKAVNVFWYEDTGETIGYGQLAHWAHIAMGKVPSYIGGEWTLVRALTEREEVEFPEPCGLVPVYHVGHPEPVTIPRYIETSEATCKGGILPESNITLTKAVDKLLFIKTSWSVRWTCKFFLKLLPLLSGSTEEREVVSAFRSDVKGKKRGRETSFSYAVVGKVARLTSAPASITAQMISERQVESRGVFPPEGCPDLNIETFMKELKRRNVEIVEMKK